MPGKGKGLKREPGKILFWVIPIILGLIIAYVYRNIPPSLAGNALDAERSLVITGYQSDTELPQVWVSWRGKSVDLSTEDRLELKERARELSSEGNDELKIQASATPTGAVIEPQIEESLSGWIAYNAINKEVLDSDYRPNAQPGPLH
ncbi:hypothetical protein A3A70_00390 [candidate division WWE3 bacterium RIFCSPLOWO2_01_FULL_42_11]|uniref:Uncharacterized protein n=1 Tax=candidate division WWE3 bacterium RIFCSPLOWO2_01_FULL_42_11 TaxID=1802627 RepID=A0A1F4VN31_UNCKA|nr:MAG: hypothetical protein A3A70_00390 [candidate division WWE3 bacterium RIFCSPLOWO2_01_FULL_42_11]